MNKIFTLALILSCFTKVAFAQVIYVKATATGANNGTSWQNAYTSLGAALINAKNTQIWVATDATYKPDRDSIGNLTPADSRKKTFRLRTGVLLYGGFVGNETALSQRNPSVNSTILSGDIGVLNDSTDNVYNVVVALNLTATAIIDGFTIKSGRGNGTTTNNKNGAGVLAINDYIWLTINNCTFLNNVSSGSGGAVYADVNTYFEVNTTTFQNNKASGYGGALVAAGGLTINNCVFNKNIALKGGAISGLGLFVTSCQFTSNSVYNFTSIVLGIQVIDGGEGGAVYTNDYCYFTDCAFIANAAFGYVASTSIDGGAIYQKNGDLQIDNCFFSGNALINTTASSTFNSGAAVYTQGGTCTITSSFFYNGLSQGSQFASGGALYVKDKTSATITNCLLLNNKITGAGSIGAFGGGIYMTNSNADIVNCTFYGNQSDFAGGFTGSGSTYAYKIKNCILWNNIAASDAQIANSSNLTVSYSLIQGGIPSAVTNGGNNTTANPLFVNESNLGGSDNRWLTSDDGLLIKPNSPAARTGTANSAPTVDILGRSRIGNPSMGCFEPNGNIPVELIDFTGKMDKNTNLLMWHTASEINNSGFEIERSSDGGKNFKKIGFVTAKGQNSEYEFTDTEPFSVSYYRLKQLDFNGAFSYSKIISLKQNKPIFPKIYPNPVVGNTLSFDSSSDNVDVDIFNQNGQLLLTIKNTLPNKPIDVEQLPHGTYLLVIKADHQTFTQTFMKL